MGSVRMWQGLKILLALRLEERTHTDTMLLATAGFHFAFKSVSRSDLVKMSHSESAVSRGNIILQQSELSAEQVNSPSLFSLSLLAG